jgi:hypothetical protein
MAFNGSAGSLKLTLQPPPRETLYFPSRMLSGPAGTLSSVKMKTDQTLPPVSPLSRVRY